MSLGALAVSITDVPGPLRHRINGMGICILLLFSVSLISAYASYNVVLLGVVVTISGFVFSMLTIYGLRSSAVGIAVMVIMIISLNFRSGTISPWLNSLLISAGAVWYMIFSISLYHLRPYKLIQQELGDLLIELSGYLSTRAKFYEDHPDYEKIYLSLLQQQTHIEEKKGLLRELIFKTRVLARESNYIGRNLIKIFLESDELLEGIMTTYHSYDHLHKIFGKAGILKDFQKTIYAVSAELIEIGLALKSGNKSTPGHDMNLRVQALRNNFEKLRLENLSSSNIEDFIVLGRILRNLENLASKVNSLHKQTAFDKKIKVSNKDIQTIESGEVGATDIRFSLFISNLNLSSNIFRHSIRVSIALLTGYVIGIFINLGHSSWILLTVLVILKPAYSLTKRRNRDRLLGTAIGLVIGALLIYFIKDNHILLAFMILFMLGSYSFIKTHYFTAVIFLSAEVLILFNLLSPGSVSEVLEERLLDTFIGSVIAFIYSLLIFPVWEISYSRKNMYELLYKNLEYYKIIASAFLGNAIDLNNINNARKNALISLSNSSDSFNKMLSEPKRYQQGIQSIHNFIVLNYTLLSHVSALSYYLTKGDKKLPVLNIGDIVTSTQKFLESGSACLLGKKVISFPDSEENVKIEDEYSASLQEKRKSEVQSGLLETTTKSEYSFVKTIINQFEYIHSLSVTLSKICREKF